MPEPIRGAETNMCQLDEANETGAPPAPPVTTRAAPPLQGAEEPAPSPRAVQQLVSASLPRPSTACLTQAADTVKSGGALLAAGAAVFAAAPTLFGVAVAGAAFIGLSAVFGANLAKLENCEDEAAARAKPK
jgi:hypothetical protein